MCRLAARLAYISYLILNIDYQLQEVGDFQHKCSYEERMLVEPQNCHKKF